MTPHFESSIFFHIDKTRKKIFSWDSIVCKLAVAIVHRVVTQLLPNIPRFNSREKLMIIKTSNRNEKRLHSIIIIIYNQFCKHCCMCSMPTKCTWPEFCSLDMRCVDNKLVCIFIKSCCCLETLNV